MAACCDRIRHTWLLEHVPMDTRLLTSGLKAGSIARTTFHATEEGTPHGGIISPTLCTMTLDGLEAVLKARFKRCKVNLIR